MSGAVHYSHHSCNQPWEHAGLVGDGTLGGIPFRGCPAIRFPKGHAGGLSQTYDPTKWTCDRGLVTCRRCLRESYDQPRNRDIVKQMWLVCCRGRGAAWPLSTAELEQHEAEQRRDALADAYSTLLVTTVPSLRIFGKEPGPAIRRQLEEFAGLLTDTERNELRPALAEIGMAAELADEIVACIRRAGALDRFRSPKSEPHHVDDRMGGG